MFCCLSFDLYLFLTAHLIYTLLLIIHFKLHLPNHWLQQEEKPFVISKHEPQEASVASGEISGVSSADTEISGTSGVSGVSTSGDDEEPVTVIIETKEGQS